MIDTIFYILIIALAIVFISMLIVIIVAINKHFAAKKITPPTTGGTTHTGGGTGAHGHSTPATDRPGFWDWVGRVLGVLFLLFVLWSAWSIYGSLFPTTSCIATKTSPCYLKVKLEDTIWTGGIPVKVKFNRKTSYITLGQTGVTLKREDVNPGMAMFLVPEDSKVDQVLVEIF